MTERDRLSRRLKVSVAAFAAGLVLMFAGVAVFGSRWVVGISFAVLLAAGSLAYLWFRCPFCGNAMLHYTLKEMRGWLTGGPHQCPFCAGDFDAADTPAEPAVTA